MEAQSPKRRRVYSLEPNKVVQEVFTRNYVRYLVPALVKIKESGSSEHNKHCDFHNVVKHEVGMAMVFSAQGFAWSDALKVKLLRGHANVDKGSSLNICDQDVMVPMNLISSNSNPSSKSKYIDMPENKRNCLVGEENEDEVTNNKLTCLRRLIPGGEKMCNEQMVVELESYISCLQMQVNVLQCLAKTP
ncbi:PREDICTED: uncharacterized protein At4g30180-like isoform X3 [Lupinus angustifolius]|uniref:uncharacterized protein At4g30180-like isoform X2 n=1 Tax=Lupinus angustifolius TaxID=3871 RepID=UPI00092E5789|nr:PREDICTED: uncharacterized protein At4g30180-like isoform X2 [Lupinus angustifolius]XP_019431522.1 PREDICTED: uncharacterized protein At4g30180-like isoform X3 [Lupinus angustifolius]